MQYCVLPLIPLIPSSDPHVAMEPPRREGYPPRAPYRYAAADDIFVISEEAAWHRSSFAAYRSP